MTQTSASDAVKLLAAAASTARLYPPTSPLPAEAVERFTAFARELVSPVHLTIEPHGFLSDVGPICERMTAATTLAETLHALQIGELIIAPGMEHSEAASLLHVITSDPAAVRAAGGARAHLVAEGCTHVAVVEVSVRAVEDIEAEGELDLIALTPEEIAERLPGITATWLETAENGVGTDQIAEAMGRVEHAAKGAAQERVRDALMRLDDESRMRVLASALRSDTTGKRMEGLLGAVAQMRPAALARLLKMTAERSATDPARIASVLQLPPETLAALERLLDPPPLAAEEIAETPPPETLAADAAMHDDRAPLEALCAGTTDRAAFGRALATSVAVSRAHPDAASVESIGTALPGAIRAGALGDVREAMRRLDELNEDPEMCVAVSRVQATLQDPDVLTSLCLAPATDADAAIAGEILTSAGPAGAEALLHAWADASPETRALLRPSLRAMGQPIIATASRELRAAGADEAVAIVRVLPQVGDSRAVPTIEQALGHLDINVRRAAVTALAEIPSRDGRVALCRAVSHWDPATQRFAVREIGRVGADEAIPVLVRAIDDINPFGRGHDLKKEIIISLGTMKSPAALPVLQRIASRRMAMGRKDKELRLLAQQTAENLERRMNRETEGVDRT